MSINDKSYACWVSRPVNYGKGSNIEILHRLELDPQECICDVRLKCIVPDANSGYAVGEYASCISFYAGNVTVDPPVIPTLLQDRIILQVPEPSNSHTPFVIMSKAEANSATTIFLPSVECWQLEFRIWYPKKIEIPVVSGGVPAGIVMYSAMSNIPEGWLKCDGRPISRNDYANLYEAIGDIYGPTDCPDSFKLPDLRGEFIRCLDDERGVDAHRQLGSFQEDENKEHDHEIWKTMRYVSPIKHGEAGSCAPWVSGTYMPQLKTGVQGTESRPRNVALMAIIKY